MLSINSATCLGGFLNTIDTIIDVTKLHNIATDPNPSGEIPNHHSDFGGISPNQPSLNFIM